MPPLDYILGMKLESGRERDKHDSAEIIRRLKLTSGVIGQKVCKAKLMNILEIEVISLAF